MTESNEDVKPTDVTNIWQGVVTNKFYFNDETFDLNGPFDTIPEAEASLQRYCNEVLGPPPAVNTTANLPQSTVKYYGA